MRAFCSGEATCLVTGGAGFIGCALAPHLLGCFDQVVVLDSLHPQVHPRRIRPDALPEQVHFIEGDVTVPTAWDALLVRHSPTLVVHLAAETGTGQSLTAAHRHAEVNVAGLACMLDAMVRHDKLPRRIVLASSRAVYGEGAWQGPEGIVYPGQRTKAQLEKGQWDFPGLEPLPFMANKTQPHPTSIYGITKLAQEQVLAVWGEAMGVEVGILRLQNVYGPGQSLSNPYTGVVSTFATLAAAHKSIPVYEDGHITRDFVFIDDVAAALRAVITRTELPPHPLDVGSGQAVTIAEVAARIARRYGAPEPHINGAFRHGDVRHAACELAPTMAALDWRPQVFVEEGLERFCQWVDQQRQKAS
jgi:dTDP-L-rhamnose 4-epimerase